MSRESFVGHKQKNGDGHVGQVQALVLGILMILLAAICAGCTDRSAPVLEYGRDNFAMDTLIHIQVCSADPELAKRALDEAFAEFSRIGSLTDKFAGKNLSDPDASDVYRINKNAGTEPVTVSEDTLAMLERSIYFAGLSDGAFDVTIGPLMDLWGFGQAQYHVPSDRELEPELDLVGYEQIVVDRVQKTVYLPHKGMELDLGGIAKGYAVDKAAQKLRQMGIESALINAGGNIYALGSQPDGSPWLAGIRDPRDENQLIAVLGVKDMAVVTSGDYNRYFIRDGIRYHHILNPATGMPARGVISTTIVAANATDADVLATTLFVLGPGSGKELMDKLFDVSAVFVDDMNNIICTEGLADQIEFTGSEAYTVKKYLK